MLAIGYWLLAVGCWWLARFFYSHRLQIGASGHGFEIRASDASGVSR
jgi:hypothetical protein